MVTLHYHILDNDLCNFFFYIQAEAWIKGKLQDLKDGCNVQRCPLQDWEEASQTLQRDLKDFENTLIQLNQVMIINDNDVHTEDNNRYISLTLQGLDDMHLTVNG